MHNLNIVAIQDQAEKTIQENHYRKLAERAGDLIEEGKVAVCVAPALMMRGNSLERQYGVKTQYALAKTVVLLKRKCALQWLTLGSAAASDVMSTH
jgi:hypothetical protein